MTGTEAIYYIREYEKVEGMRRVPVVAISGNVQPAEQSSYFQAGMDGFLAKPFKRDEFLRMLNKYKPKDPQEATQTTPKQTPQTQEQTPAHTQTPVLRRANSTGTQSASAPAHAPAHEPQNYSKTAPPAQTSRPKQRAPSPVPFRTHSEPELSVHHETPAEKTGAATSPRTPTSTNRRPSVSALASPYNLIPLNSSAMAGMPPLPEEDEEEVTFPSPANTPAHTHHVAYPYTPQMQTPSKHRRASSPARVGFDIPENPAHVAPVLTPRTPPHNESPPRATTPRTEERTSTHDLTPSHQESREFANHEYESSNHAHNVRILVADNSQADRQIYKRMLSQYQADIVGSGTSALDLFDTNNYDVILLDCNLEDMEIRDLVSQIRRKEQLSNQHVPIVLVCTTAKQEEEFRGVGVSQILIKGRGFINRDILLQALLRSVNIIPGDAPITLTPKDLFDTSELVDSLFLAQISRSNFFSELFQLFIGCTEKIVVNMNKYLREHDSRGLVVEAHNCSSISANIGAVWLSRLATELRVAASKVQGKELPPDIPNLVERVINGVDLTLEYLEKCRIISRSADGKWVTKKAPSILSQSEEIHNKDVHAMGKTRVLVVDDMPMTQFIVTTLLNKLHFSCNTVSNGLEAVAEIKKNTYDLILMDNYMDQMTGIEAVAQIREHEKTTGKRTPVIGLTSLVGNNTLQEEVVPQLIRAGMDDVIFKPILRNSFLSRLEIWRPQLADAFTWTLELDTTLLDELVQSAPTTITQAIPRIIELSNRVSSVLVQALGDIKHQENDQPQLMSPISELIELCSMLGASRLAEVAKILCQYLSTREVSEHTAHRLVQIYAVVRASTVDSLHKYTSSRLIEPAENRSVNLSPSSTTALALSSPPPPLSLNPPSSTSSTSPQIRVLVADDQPLTRMVIKSMVAKAYPQVDVDMAENGELAVAKADTVRYDLILMDIGMPIMDGYKASQLIRVSEAMRRSEPMSIVAITAGSVTKANDATAYQEAGMNELIHKPFSNAKLMAIFNKYIFEKDKPQQTPAPAETYNQSTDTIPMSYPDEMILNSEILDMLRGLGILERTVETFEKHSKELLQRARLVDPSTLQKRSNIRQSIHAMKGISLNSGASMLGRMCDDLERVVLDCDRDTIVKMLDMIDVEFARAMKRFKEIR
eukprot:Phypoly_transcript_00597.p1 GENE.Phypoly_transcript_00597~~Phypoly_transcript_00597.p1  ORF type:complete len:1275 (+),score=264.33 Phypoly_transcript_00597:342-3827(+)